MMATDVGQQVLVTHKVRTLKEIITWRPNLAAVRAVRAIGDQIDAELALGSLNRCIGLARGDVVAFGIKLEMMD